MRDKSLRVSLVLSKCWRKTLTPKAELQNYDAIDIRHNECICLFDVRVTVHLRYYVR
jgi:hypothetical protein